MILLKARIALAILSHAPACVLGKAVLLLLGTAVYFFWSGQVSWLTLGAAVATGIMGLVLIWFQADLALWFLASNEDVAMAWKEEG